MGENIREVRTFCNGGGSLRKFTVIFSPVCGTFNESGKRDGESAKPEPGERSVASCPGKEGVLSIPNSLTKRWRTKPEHGGHKLTRSNSPQVDGHTLPPETNSPWASLSISRRNSIWESGILAVGKNTVGKSITPGFDFCASTGLARVRQGPGVPGKRARGPKTVARRLLRCRCRHLLRSRMRICRR